MTNYYFDYAATTPIDPSVADSMMDCLKNERKLYGNPSSTLHSYGKSAFQLIEVARQHIADLIHTTTRNIIFTSGATEANNLAIKGVAQHYQSAGRHIITAYTEHPSVLEPCAFLAKQGFEITYLKPNSDGIVTAAEIEKSIRRDTILVSLMHVNNETGIIQNIAEIGAVTKARKVLFHVDAVQSLGKIAIDLEVLPVDLMSFSAHKIYGPKGIGALYVGDKPRVKLASQIQGGSQERKFRAGTLATHQIIGMGEACRIMNMNMQEEFSRMTELRNQLWQGMQSIPGIELNIPQHLLATSKVVPGILNVRFVKYTKEQIIKKLEPYAVSLASACNSISQEPSHVLRAMNMSPEDASKSVRFSIGRFTTEADIRTLLEHLQIFKS